MVYQLEYFNLRTNIFIFFIYSIKTLKEIPHFLMYSKKKLKNKVSGRYNNNSKSIVCPISSAGRATHF
jgi:hypothetical protein